MTILRMRTAPLVREESLVMRASLWRFAAATLLGISLAASYGCGKRAVATVNGEKITQDAFYKRLQRQPVAPNVPFPPPIETQAATIVLDQMIREALFLQLAEKEGVMPDQAQIDERKKELNGALNDRGQDLATLLSRSGMSHKELDERLKPELAQMNVLAKHVKVTDEEVRQAYDNATRALPADQKYRSAFYLPESAKVYIIQCASRQKIMEAKKQLDQGMSFGVAAEKYSEDENTNKNRGEIPGWVNKPDPVRPAPQGTPPEFFQKVFSMSKGQTSEPFRVRVPLPDGQVSEQWLIVRVEDKKPARMQPFEHVKGVIRDRILQQKASQDKKLVKMFTDLRPDAKIEVLLPNYKEVFARVQENLQKQQTITEKAITGGTGGTAAPAAPGGGQ